MDCTVHGVAKRRTRLSLYHFTSLSLSCFGIPLAKCWNNMKSKPSVASCVGGVFKRFSEGFAAFKPRATAGTAPGGDLWSELGF